MGLADWMTQEQPGQPPQQDQADALAMGNVNGHGPLMIGQPPPAPPPAAPMDPRSQATADMFSQQLNNRIGTPQTGAPAPLAPDPNAPIANDNGNAGPMPMVQPPHVVPGGWDKGRLPFQKGTIEKEEQGIVKHEQAAERLTEAVQQQGAAVSQFYDQQAELQQAQLAARQKAELDRDAKYNDATKRYQTLMDDAGTQAVDTNRWMGSQSTGSRIVMALGAAMGGFAQAMGKGPNPMLDAIQRNIDRDIEAQKNDNATKKWKAGAQLNMLGELRAQGMDERMAENAVANAQLRIAGEHLKGLMAKTDNPIQAARGKEMLAQINDERTKLSREADMYMHTNPQVVGGDMGNDKIDMSLIVRDPMTGKDIMARSPKAAEELTQIASTMPRLKAIYNEALKIRNESNTWMIPGSGDNLRLKGLQTTAEPLISKMGDNSVLRDTERADMRSSVTAFTGFRPGVEATLRQTMGMFDTNISTAFAAQGGPVVNTKFHRDAKGHIQQGAEFTGERYNAAPTTMPGKKIGR